MQNEFGNFEWLFDREVAVTALVGSHNYNLNTPVSDEDWKYFVVPTFEDLYNGKFFSTAAQSETLDYDVHDVRQLGALLWKANINFLEVLFSKRAEWMHGLDGLWRNPEKWATMNLPTFRNATYGTFLEKMKTLNKGTAKTMGAVEKFGYDTKQACHALRQLLVLEKFADTRSMAEALWFEDGWMRDELLAVKAGWYTETEFRARVSEWHEFKKDRVMAFFDTTTPNEAAKVELDNLMFEFVKTTLRK